jgi:nucleoside-diphosphate-sugar epimerase
LKVFVTGATGVLGRAAVTAMLAQGHDVTGLARSDDKARDLEAMGASGVTLHLFDSAALAAALAGFDAVCNLATHIPVGIAGLKPGAWRTNDRLRSEGSQIVAQAAAAAGVRRLVQESISQMYADGADEWLSEDSPVCVTRPLEPAAVAETHADEFASVTRQSVVLRFGTLVGADPMTHWMLSRARAGHAIGFGAPESWAHVVHPEDAGTAVAAALNAPSGVYNVGAEPIRRGDMMDVFGRAVERPAVGNLPRMLVRLAGDRVEPLTRSHRVSSDRLHAATGWKPVHDAFDETWLTEPDPT